ncbi:DUF2270 domain-containing protein [Leisingera aquaemixtae]|uniref:DUF2270 domain-containing protein n=1 Tax=Leisingera TaxID=191028 RepID=UPI001C964110|nr:MULTISPECIES: DUF2270 domain-containing protein [Leisingera]MBY6067672.1 DUF2270 domain-containing protein [Leisingera aquaemixtae]MCB4456632.1 DUF2270 domain-containing protein [Leisingera sp. McT4-56]
MTSLEREQTAGGARAPLSAEEVGALAHLYRGEIYRSTVWRTRLDTTTNWSVVTLGVALSISYASPEASPLPLILVGVLIIFFLMLEARRYRYFNVFRARARWLETHFYTPMLVEGDLHLEEHWQDVLAADYLRPEYHVGVMTAIGRRIRRNYFWVLLIQSMAYAGKLAVHPTGVTSWQQALGRADIGPFPGELVLATGAFYVLLWGGIAWWSARTDAARARKRKSMTSMG